MLNRKGWKLEGLYQVYTYVIEFVTGQTDGQTNCLLNFLCMHIGDN